LARRAVLRRELAESGEGDLFAIFQRICDRLDHGIHCLARFTTAKAALLCHTLDELLLVTCTPLLLLLDRLGSRQTLTGRRFGSTMR